MKTATKNENENGRKTKRGHIIDFLTDNPALSFEEVRKKLLALGFEKFGSSELSDCRRKLGLIPDARTRSRKVNLGPLTIHELEQICDLPDILGVEMKEAIQICEAVAQYAAKVGGLPRLSEALQIVARFNSVRKG